MVDDEDVEGGRGASPSQAQLAIMQIVWDCGEATVADVWKKLAEARPVARNTIQTMMTRLEEKGWLKSRIAGRAFLYQAARSREQVLGGMVNRLLDSAFGGSAEGLILTLLKERGVSPDEAKRIRKMIDGARKTGRSDG